MAYDALVRECTVVELPNPFSIKFSDAHPHYRPGASLAGANIIPGDSLKLKMLTKAAFPTASQRQEYGRDVMVQIIRDWLHPRLNQWCRVMADQCGQKKGGEGGIVEVTEVVMHTLWNVHQTIEHLMSLFFLPEERTTLAGRAFRMELRERLLPWITLKNLYRVITRTLEVAYNCMREMIDFTVARSHPPPPFSEWTPADEIVYGPERHGDTSIPPLEMFILADGTRIDKRESEAIVLLKRIRAFYRDINADSSLLWGLSTMPAFSVAKKRALCVVDEAMANLVDGDMYSTIQRGMREVHVFMRWFAPGWPAPKSDRVTEVNPRTDGEEEDEGMPDRKRTDMLVDLEQFWEKATIERLALRIYAICIDMYPRSKNTVELLRFCLDRQNHYARDLIVQVLIRDVSDNLLNVGTPTGAILQAYANAVDSLRQLDASCVIMHKVCKVIKEYIKKRTDTVRQIITYITTEKRNDIDFTKQASTIVMDDEDVAGVNDEFLPAQDNTDEPRWDKWTPDPPDAQPGDSCRVRRSADVFNMLVSVYGSKEMFVKEYRQLLAERLSNPSTRDPDFERKYLNLLHLRFSDGELQQCEVMLRDVEQSVKVNERTTKIAPLIKAHIVSSHFWPNIDQEKNAEKLPDNLEAELDAYNGEYGYYKPKRKLNFLRSSGWTHMSLKMDGIEVERSVPNGMAVVLYAFLEKDEWDVTEMAELQKISKQLAKRRMEWWEAQGVLSQYLPAGATVEVFKLSKHPQNMLKYKSNAEGDEEESDAEEVEDPMDAVESLEQYWKYTKTFIANQEHSEIKAERLLTIYRMFSSPSQQQISMDTVAAFLQRKVKLGLLTMTPAGLFKVVKGPDGNIKG